MIKQLDTPILEGGLHNINFFNGRLLSGEEGTKDVLLGPQDIVYVPRSPIANADLFVSQYIRELLPFGMNVGASYSYNHNRDPKK
mgnify:CR=1 FL=1